MRRKVSNSVSSTIFSLIKLSCQVGGMSINPINGNLLATAHLNRYLRLWDVSKLLELPEEPEDEQLDEVSANGTDRLNHLADRFHHTV